MNKISNEVISNSDIATKTELEEVKTTAENALPKTGGEVTGRVILTEYTRLRQKNMDIASADPLQSDAYNQLVFVDKNDNMCGLVQTVQRKDLQMHADLYVYNQKPDGNRVYKSLGVGITKEGITYTSAPHPRDNYSTDIVTTKFLKDYAAQKLPAIKRIYVGGSNASDTANLYAGRGETPEMPFATVEGAVKYAGVNLSASAYAPSIVLQEDLEWNDNFRIQTGMFITLSGNTSTRKLICKKQIVVYGSLYVSNLNFVGSADQEHLFYLNGGYRGTLSFAENVTFSGAANIALRITNGGLCSVSQDISGDFIGKKYMVQSGSLLLLNNHTIAGTIEGTIDSSSIKY